MCNATNEPTAFNWIVSFSSNVLFSVGGSNSRFHCIVAFNHPVSLLFVTLTLGKPTTRYLQYFPQFEFDVFLWLDLEEYYRGDVVPVLNSSNISQSRFQHGCGGASVRFLHHEVSCFSFPSSVPCKWVSKFRPHTQRRGEVRSASWWKEYQGTFGNLLKAIVINKYFGGDTLRIYKCPQHFGGG